ncbi:threonine/serine dehydratase [Lichenibacterium minor]|uniref:Threonine/serine dehydratase n=1 Tax=Lichenibacterium minor TaxID=2316528 RepID=A0A4Q2UCD8_9HYPH|nr:threonine/serine dehydratase [Lichenibacterium minor]RYC32766.1 threonine/serine dehydratase [Lichenibacterium minor]
MSTTDLPDTAALPTFDDIRAAAKRIAGICTRTPLLESPWLNRKIDGRLLLKAENLQVTGSFKLRGAANRVAALTENERRRGVSARSSGNHGLALAHCAGLMGTTATVVTPDDASSAKVERIKAHGGTVVQAPAHRIAAVAAEITAREHRVFVPPADDPWVVAGQGTAAVEIVEQARSMGLTIDVLLVCCSGGGLAAGCALALEALSPQTRLVAVEARGFEKMARSLSAGRRLDLSPGGRTICDAIGGLHTAAIPFEILKGRIADTIAVTDDDARLAMQVAFSEFGLAVEPGGAVALAAALTCRRSLADRVIAVTISGRNVDLGLAADALSPARIDKTA